jgi:hypothetical protein
VVTAHLTLRANITKAPIWNVVTVIKVREPAIDSQSSANRPHDSQSCSRRRRRGGSRAGWHISVPASGVDGRHPLVTGSSSSSVSVPIRAAATLITPGVDVLCCPGCPVLAVLSGRHRS